jgi:serine phosphatase RsbU (regulator of sigma subunit)
MPLVPDLSTLRGIGDRLGRRLLDRARRPPRRVPVLVAGDLVRQARRADPDRLLDALDAAVESLGGRDPVLYLVDHDIEMLNPVGRGAAVPVDTSVAGRAYRTQAPVEVPEGGGRRLHLPVTESSDRLGVLSVALGHRSPGAAASLAALADTAAVLLRVQAQYTDAYQRQRRRRPMGLAAEMQWQLLPPLTFETGAVTVAGLLEPAYDIGGDSLDYALNDGVLEIAIVDSMGHDLSSSLLTALVVGAYRNARRNGLGLAETYRLIDATVRAQFDDHRFSTGALARLDCRRRELTFVNAGHPLPLLLRQARTVVGEIPCRPSLPLGMGGDVVEVATVTLQPGDAVFFYSDGLVEARDAAGAQFGEARLRDLLERELSAGRLAPEIVRRVVRKVVEHQEGGRRDDITMLMVVLPGPRG